MSGTGEPIAIIGSGCRFPGDASTPSKLWDLLRDPRDLLSPLHDRFNADGWYHENGKYHGHANVKESYLLAGEGTHRLFDAPFFGINTVEANTMDPQMRCLLETVYESLEAAGQSIEKLQGSNTAVYAGLMVNAYEQFMGRDIDNIGTYHVSGTSRAMMSNRVSYFFDWHGPSMTIDTACSSSLISVHQAVQQLRSGQSRVAIAAGSNLLLDYQDYISMSKLQMLSPDSRSRMWDADANGYARGEGIAAVVLKTLSAAEADGDHIECIIRETGTNQDGKTPGITMPSAKAQAQLIRDCYARAGLDPANPEHRPQYFEAHGTGTQAGDPVEAEAISSAFFPTGAQREQNALFVGSIKTVVGHTEGTAGLAGLLKASLALQNSIVPPNLLFNNLNPKIEPFYSNLQVPTSATPWPTVSRGSPRRASVNSFGFGGANAHAILETYVPDKHPHKDPKGTNAVSFAPFVFSAASEKSLSSYMASFCEYLQANEAESSLRDLALTLHSRRTRFPFATTIAALTVQDLRDKIEHKLQTARTDTDQPVGIRPSFKSSGGQKSQILGVFTGQGAQSARMGAALIESSDAARRIIEKLEVRLSRLPKSDRPSWSLKAELLKDASSSRISQASLSQPLCTAVQILQVKLLRAASIEFSAVVGHSSGEIGAAYAAGLISAEDAICIAYYRGLHTSLAHGADGQQGAMMAVGTSFEDAQELCDSPEFESRVGVAAINSTVSVTLSGDEDAIEEMKTIFEDEHKFARRLKVDKAYHSHHMLPCSNAYLQSLRALDIQVSSSKCAWFSSVYDGKLIGANDNFKLKGLYWNDNMVNPVLLSQAVESAWISKGPFDLAIEVGPHPALKAPALQTIQDLSSQEIPYTGLSARDKNAAESFADGLGYVWTYLGKNSVKIPGYDKLLTGRSSFNLVKGLPAYSWDHEKEYWHEFRYTRAIRTRSDPVHELLGHLTPDTTDQEMRWRNILSPKEVPWLEGHALQHQTVFPAAGYVVTALEAAVAMCKGASSSLIEILDLDIGKALTFESGDSRVETLFSLSDITRHDGKTIDALFKYYATATKQGDTLDLLASGHVRVTLGDYCSDAHPVRGPREPNLLKVDTDNFYSSLLELEYQYTGPFRALSALERKLGFATGFIDNEQPSKLLVHPAVLDAAFQSVLLAQSAPGSGGIWSLHVPKTIQSVRFNPHLCAVEMSKTTPVAFDCTQPADINAMAGDVDLFADGSEFAMLHVEGLHCVPFSRATAKEDKELFATTIWDVAIPDAERIAYDGEPTSEQLKLARLLERIAVFYLRRLESDIPPNHPSRTEGAYPSFFKFASHTISLAKEGKLPLWSSQWEKDTLDELAVAYEPYSHVIDVKLLNAIGENMIDIVTGEKEAIEVGMEDNMLTQFYEQSIGIQEHTAYLARLLKQIGHRYPHMNILEVGAGTGGITKAIFQEIGHKLSSYTYTDISAGFFETAQQVFGNYLDRMLFKVLDISKDPRSQGYAEHSYDMVVASMVLHATPVLEETLRNARRLLKPGGFLVVLELQVDNLARMGTIFGAFPGWWLGADEGRVLSPCINLAEWEEVLRDTGFSGCDTATPVRNALVMPPTVFVSQAIDDHIEFLRDPLSSSLELFEPDSTAEDLILLGGGSLQTSRLIGQLKSLLRQYWGRNIKTVRSLVEFSALDISSNTTVLSLAELDTPVFKELKDVDWEALKKLLQEARTVLWVSRGRRAENPYANMMVGLLRSAKKELPTLDIQLFDFEGMQPLEARVLAEGLLQLKATTLWQRRDGQESLLATVEPEVIREESGLLVIPRLVASQERNDRYNSLRRPILVKAGPNTENVGIATSGDGFCIIHEPIPEGESSKRIRVAHSLLSAVQAAEFGCMFIVFGHNCDTGDQIVALSTKNTSLVCPMDELLVSVNVPAGSEAEFVSLVSHHMLASSALEGLSEGDTIVVHEPETTFAAVLAKEAKSRGVEFSFTTANPTPSNLICCLQTVSPSSPDRAIRALLPKNTSAFLDFSEEKGPGSIRERIHALLPAHCRRQSSNTLFSTTSWIPKASYINEIRTRLEDAVSHTLVDLEGPSRHTETVALSALSHIESIRELSPQTVVDWASISDVSIQVRPITESHAKFSDTKTYWLAGLSGGLGLSLCEWMVRHGAKYVVISSRRPNVEESWLEQMRSAGAVINVFACDVTQRHAVLEVREEITSTMPPIVGVCQGAMVLEDTPFRDMSLETLLKATRPKVEGSLHLNELFQENTLDFFVFFSSASAIPGNLGQANYSTANLFMTALAEQRRQRGLAASIMHIGPIFGVGYIAQQGITAGIQSLAEIFVPLSEQDFYQHFAETIVAGKPGSNSALEITTGVAKVGSPADASPFMSHYTKSREIVNLDASTAKSDVPVKIQLSNARGQAQVSRIIRGVLLPKLAALFQTDLDKLEKADLDKLRLDEMGIDSLLAVEIRSWFVKTLEVNIPVLKILSGVPVAELISIATETIPPSLVPNINEESTVNPEFDKQPEPLVPKQEPQQPKKLWSEAKQLEPLVSKTVQPQPKKLWSEAILPEEVESKHVSSSSGSETNLNFDFSPPDYSNGSMSPLDDDNESLSSFVSCDHPIYEEEKALLAPKPALEKSVKLSFGQSLFWFVSAFSKDQTSLNLTGSFRLTGKLRIQDLQKAVEAIGQQHESLRTCFFEQDDQPLQGIMKSSPLGLECHQIHDEKEVTDYFAQIHNYIYDLKGGKTIRLALLSLSPTEHFFIMGAHHLAMDGLSFQVFMKDLLQNYTYGYQNHIPRQYAECSEKQHADFAAGKLGNDLQFWKTELAELPPTLPILRLSTAISRPALSVYGNERVDIRIAPEIKKQLQNVCRRCRATPFHFYLAVFRALLWRYTSAEHISIGIGDANRTDDDMMGSIGDFVNVLPLQFRTQSSARFETLLQETRTKTYAALAHSKVPFQVLLNELGVPRSSTTSPIFQAFVDYRQGQREKTTWGDCQLELLSFHPSKLAYDLALDIVDNADGDCLMTFVVRDDLYSRQDAERLAKSYELLIKAFASQSKATLGEPDMFDLEEIEEALSLGKDPVYQSRQWGKTVIHRIDDIAKKHPNKTAVITGDNTTVTYREIVTERANAIAVELVAAGIAPGASVAVLQEPTPDWVSSILAVMRIGATYLPLDLGTPWARLAVMVKDCQPGAVLVDETTKHSVGELQRPEMTVIDVSALEGKEQPRVPISTTADSVSTILYSSGSSGTPKGIILNHQGMRAWLEPCAMLYNMNDEVLLQQSSQGFDMSLMQIFTAICFGGKVYLLPRRFRGDARAIGDAISHHGITHTYGTPSEYFSWLKYTEPEALRTSSWKTALVGGEFLARSLLKEFAALNKSDLRFLHMYGTTESTFCASVMELPYTQEASEDDNTKPNYPAGVALPNYTLYVLDEQMKPLPSGLQGEIAIGGAGVGFGYLNNPSLTDEKFVKDIFATDEDRARGWTMMQRTGDLGRWREDGAIFIEGRISGDTQVKLRGLRLDLREVENAMLHTSNGALNEVVVSVRRASPESPEFLVAHVVFDQSHAQEDHEQSIRLLRSRLELPQFMCPAFIIPVDRMPATASGKLDRKAVAALPLPEDNTSTEEIELTPTEERLKRVWEDVLSSDLAKIHRITPETDFFHVGGTSLLLLGLQEKIKVEFKVEITLVDLFELSVLSSMARKLEGESEKLEDIKWEEETVLTPAILELTKGPLHPVKHSNSKVVILTGGSGYLGKGLIRDLIADPTVKEIHCLGVRNAASRTEIIGLDKVSLYEGDLKQPRIGLSQEVIDDLFGRADLIIHNGADISYMKTYQSLRQSNALTTKELVEWSMPRMVPIHYISTAGIGMFAPGTPFGASSAARFPPPIDGSMGYTACKWASEQFLERLVKQYPEWPVCVHRPSLISRDDIPQLDLAHNFLKYSRLLGAVPSSHGRARGVMNVVQLNTRVKGILDCALPEYVSEHEKGKVHFVNHIGKLDLPFNDMRKWALDRNEDGYVDFAEIDLKEIPADDWARRAGDLGMHPTIVAFLTSFATVGEVEFPIVTKDAME